MYTDAILSTISSGFAASGNYPSMVLVLEHLDVLCPGSKSTGQGTLLCVFIYEINNRIYYIVFIILI